MAQIGREQYSNNLSRLTRTSSISEDRKRKVDNRGDSKSRSDLISLDRSNLQSAVIDSRKGRDSSLVDLFLSRKREAEEFKVLRRAIDAGYKDPGQLTDLIFYARHPDMIGLSLNGNPNLLNEWNSINSLLVHPALNERKSSSISVNMEEHGLRNSYKYEDVSNLSLKEVDRIGRSSNFDEVITESVEWCPGLSPSLLKSLLVQESNLNPKVINQYGYAGIAQLGRREAREVGLYVGLAGRASDERLNPYRAIPGAARLLNIKAQRLNELAFEKYGQPNGMEFWKFVVGAYNGGEATVATAMGHAYRVGVEQGRRVGLVGTELIKFARDYASKWDNLTLGGLSSPLGLAASRYFPSLAAEKYHEIGNYPKQIMARAFENSR